MDRNDIKEELAQLCSLAITLLEKSKDTGLISESEYHKNIHLKKQFLAYINKSK